MRHTAHKNSTCVEQEDIGCLLNSENFKNAVLRRKMKVSQLNNVSEEVSLETPQKWTFQTAIKQGKNHKTSGGKPIYNKKITFHRRSLEMSSLQEKLDHYYTNNKSLAFEDCMDFSDDENIQMSPPTKKWNLIQKFICGKHVQNFSNQIEEISRQIKNPKGANGRRKRYRTKRNRGNTGVSQCVPFQSNPQTSFMIPHSSKLQKNIKCPVFSPVRKGSIGAQDDQDCKRAPSVIDQDPEFLDGEIIPDGLVEGDKKEPKHKSKLKSSNCINLFGSFCRRASKKKAKEVVENSRNSFIMPDIHSLGPVKLTSSHYSQAESQAKPNGLQGNTMRESFAKKFAASIDEGSMSERSTSEEVYTTKSKHRFMNQCSKIWSSSTNEDQTNGSDSSERNILFKNSVKLPNLTPIAKILKKTYISTKAVVPRSPKKSKNPKMRISKKEVKKSKNIANISVYPGSKLFRRSASIVPHV
ncbi:unnamed protein product [Moneuplotes crassus]|uniref:Uncharacterized protein n=1 Tax=Euplotes crassus TaxID=5936 RepID=A0AAD1Y912_EUPCR|nr:unnamed protein product [Moneuplotes crassus]